MKRIDTSTRAVDLYGAGKDGYKDGNKALGISATDLNASALNALQEEIANVIEGAGAALNPADNTQLLQAITNLVKGSADKIVRVASTAAINLAAPGASIDGVAMVAGDTFLEKDNATLADRGIYVWHGAAVPATRDPAADTGAELFGGMIIRVKEGTVNADTNWQVTNDGVVTVGVTGLTFKKVGEIVANDIGSIAYFAKNTAPTGYLKANGALVSRTSYAALFAAIGTTFGAGDGLTTFALPDLRGEFIRGWDDARGIDSDRVFGSSQLDQMQLLTGSVTSIVAGLNAVTPSGAITANKTSSSGATGGTNRDLFTVGFNSSLSPDARVSSTTSGETRSRNIALLACIKF